MNKNLSRAIYCGLAVSWLLFAAWLYHGHTHALESSQAAQLLRSKDISNTLGVLIRSQRRFGVVQQRRIEAMLEELAKSSELLSLALLNSSGAIVAAAGDELELNFDPNSRAGAGWNQGVRWLDDAVLIVNLVDLGGESNDAEDQRRRSTILLRDEDLLSSGTLQNETRRSTETALLMGPPLFSQPFAPRFDNAGTSGTYVLAYDPTEESRRQDRGNRWRLMRQAMRNMDELDWDELRKKQGLHGFVLKMSIANLLEDNARDANLRLFLGVFGLLAALGLAAAWRALGGAMELRLKLERSNQLNAHLQELNITAAGLAHETRNPLNIVRGLAQLIWKDGEVGNGLRQKAEAITEEVDRVTGRLNEFINYSRQPEPKLKPVQLRALIADVEQALESDRCDKSIQFALRGADATVQADPALLRQVMFNLILNAYQTLPENGSVEVQIETNRDTATLVIHDDGPGIPAGQHEEIFKPYVTTREKGTGLGLAVVRQIVQAHGWEIGSIANGQTGATFRLSGMKLV